MGLYPSTLLCAILALAPGTSDIAVQAAFLFNFPKFVEWPAGAFATPDAPLHICVHGSRPLWSFLKDEVEGNSVAGHRVEVRDVTRALDLSECQIVFIGIQEASRLHHLLEQTRGRPILTVSELPAFAERGGIIGLKLDGTRLKLVVNHSAARRSGLDISSRLLRVAAQVIDEGKQD